MKAVVTSLMTSQGEVLTLCGAGLTEKDARQNATANGSGGPGREGQAFLPEYHGKFGDQCVGMSPELSRLWMHGPHEDFSYACCYLKIEAGVLVSRAPSQSRGEA